MVLNRRAAILTNPILTKTSTNLLLKSAVLSCHSSRWYKADKWEERSTIYCCEVANISFRENQSIQRYLGMGTNAFFCQKSLADSTWRKQHRASSESANSSSLYLILRIQKSEPRSRSARTVWLSAIISTALCATPLVALFSPSRQQL